jgi:hypothetical protein
MWIRMVACECNLGRHLTDHQGAVITRQGVAADCLGVTVACWVTVTPGFKAKPDAHRMYAQDQVVIHTVRM